MPTKKKCAGRYSVKNNILIQRLCKKKYICDKKNLKL